MSRGRIFLIFFVVIIAFGLVAFAMADRVIEFRPDGLLEKVAETVEQVINPNADLGPQPQLANPPPIIKAIYVTGYSAGSANKLAYFMDLLRTTELNAVVLDIKDYTGDLSYQTEIPQVNEYKAWEKKIPKINALIKKFHDAGVYVIGRIAVFQDSRLVLARPDLALHSSSTGAVWRDYKKVAWLDTAATPVWDYNIAIAKDALARGFDEINFDYIRFASDGNIKDIKYPYFDETTLKHNTVKKFFEYVRKQMPNARLSADLFGLVTEDKGDMGIGQHLEDAFLPFDFIAPMTYPSHYAAGTHGFASPAAHPYEIMKLAIDSAVLRLTAYNKQLTIDALQQASSTASNSVSSSQVSDVKSRLSDVAKLRPWIQDFDLGADYTAAMVRAQIQAIYDAGCPPLVAEASSTSPAARLAPCSDLVQGWMLWNPSNVYTKEALLPET